MRERIVRILLFLSIPLALLLAYLLMDPVRTYLIEPLIYALRIESLIYQAIPEWFWWSLFLIFLGVVAIRSLNLEPKRPSRTRKNNRDHSGRANDWREMVLGTERGRYSRWLLAREVAHLTLDVISHQERTTRGQARNLIKAGQVQLPAEFHDYVIVGLDSPSYRRYTDFLAYLRSSRHAEPLDIEPEVIIEYLENLYKIGGHS